MGGVSGVGVGTATFHLVSIKHILGIKYKKWKLNRTESSQSSQGDEDKGSDDEGETVRLTASQELRDGIAIHVTHILQQFQSRSVHV